jgi:predicted RNA methylase
MKLNTSVLDVLKQCTVTGHNLTMPQLDRQTYVQVNKAIECLGGKWDRRAKAHVFEDDPYDRINLAVMTGEVVDAKKEFQFFPTPKPLAHKLIQLADIDPAKHRILEPSAGKGGLLLPLYESIPLSKWPSINVVAVELDKSHRSRLEQFTDELHFKDFLTCNGDLGKFDRIIMNPPFTKGQDIDHVQHASKFLNPGGRLVAITSPGWEFRNDSRHTGFRDFIETRGCHVEDIPEGAFAESGTPIRTKLVVINN